MGNKHSHQYDAYYTKMTIDPYKVLGLDKNVEFTWDDLKTAYRRVSMQVHPDKGGSTELFNTVSECFRTLALELKAREASLSHFERKRQAQQYYDREQEQVERFRQANLSNDQQRQMNDFALDKEDELLVDKSKNKGSRDHKSHKSHKGHKDDEEEDEVNEIVDSSDFKGDEFDFNTKFNKIFEESRVDDVGHDFGYGEMMAKSTKDREDFSIERRLAKYTHETFNRTFDEVVKPAGTDVTIYREPEALPMCRKLAYVELGADKPNDYTRSEDTDSRSLKYTDYIRAHTTERLVDPRAIKTRKEYKDVEEYEKARDRTIKKKQTKEELQFIAQKKKEEEEAEEARLARLKTYDAKVAQRYELAQNRLSFLK